MQAIQAIKEMIEQDIHFVRTLHAMALEMEEQNRRLYALEENRKMKDATISQLQQEIATLKILARKKVESK